MLHCRQQLRGWPQHRLSSSRRLPSPIHSLSSKLPSHSHSLGRKPPGHSHNSPSPSRKLHSPSPSRKLPSHSRKLPSHSHNSPSPSHNGLSHRHRSNLCQLHQYCVACWPPQDSSPLRSLLFPRLPALRPLTNLRTARTQHNTLAAD